MRGSRGLGEVAAQAVSGEKESDEGFLLGVECAYVSRLAVVANS